MRLSSRKTFTAKDAKDAKEGQKRGSVQTRSVKPIRLAWHPPVAVYLSLAFLRVLCGDSRLNLTPHRAAPTHGEF
jgi:hypothetical protein